MPRIKKPRFVSRYPTITAFVPRGMFQTGEITLSLEGRHTVEFYPKPVELFQKPW